MELFCPRSPLPRQVTKDLSTILGKARHGNVLGGVNSKNTRLADEARV